MFERAPRSLVLVTCAVLSGTASAAENADRIFINGAVWTGEDSAPAARAIAVRGDRLLAVGSNEQIKALANARTVVEDLGGRRVVPGFHDAHTHFPGSPADQLFLNEAANLRDIQRMVAEYAHAHPEKAWITGEGWAYSAFPDNTPNRAQLDAIIPDRPVYLWDRDGHGALANTKALELGGITRDTANPPNGEITRDSRGELTGELKEAAMRLMDGHVPAPDPEQVYAALLANMDEAASKGLTSVQNAWWSKEDHRSFLRAAAAGRLKLRFRFATPIVPGGASNPTFGGASALTPDDLAGYRELRDTYRGPMLEFGIVKGFLDGTVDKSTAAMFEPYTRGGTGILFWKTEDLEKVVALYDREGFQIMLHAIGDRGIAQALDAFEHAAKVNGTSGRRHRIEHLEVARPADLPRMARLGVIASTQPLFANPDATTLGNYSVLLGPKRAALSNAFKLFDDAHVRQAFGSDWSVVDMSPLEGMYAAVARTTPEGTPEGGWYPQNRIGIEAALRHYTVDGAFASFSDEERGTLVAGKLADFVVLSRDILAVEPAELLRTQVLLTVLGGRDTFRAEKWQ
jgi:predicted amidohydrolase YtcJ